MVKMITEENIQEVLNESLRKLEEAEGIIGGPACNTDKVGEYRAEGLRAVKYAQEVLTNLIRNSYKLL